MVAAYCDTVAIVTKKPLLLNRGWGQAVLPKLDDSARAESIERPLVGYMGFVIRNANRADARAKQA